MRDLILGDYRSFSEKLNQMVFKWQRVMAWYQSLSTINTTVMSGLIYLYIALKALFGAFGVGSIVTYVGSLTQFKNGFTGLVDVLSDVFINAEALQEVFDFIDMPDKKYHGTLPWKSALSATAATTNMKSSSGMCPSGTPAPKPMPYGMCP